MDIFAPSLMFGLAVGRVGCFLNGCCWGAVCDPHMAWGATFPYGSNPFVRQWQARQVTAPAELIYIDAHGAKVSPLGYDALHTPIEKRLQIERALTQSNAALAQAKSGGDEARLSALTRQRDAALKAASVLTHLSRQEVKFRLSPQELLALAMSHECRSAPVHPVQLYAAVNAALIAAVMNTWFYRRKRHGMVACLFFFTYPLARFAEEVIRSDNPQDTLGLTISQFVSLTLVLVGIVWFVVVRRLPPRSPKLEPAPQHNAAGRPAKAGRKA
jgi:phosphatidylglycerol:prolipoprotein diacylglycerol transferase